MTEATATAPAKRAWRWPWREPSRVELAGLRFLQSVLAVFGALFLFNALVWPVPRPTRPLEFVMGALFFGYGLSALKRWRVSIPFGAAVGVFFGLLATSAVLAGSFQTSTAVVAAGLLFGAFSFLAFIGMREPLPSRPAAMSSREAYESCMRGEGTPMSKSDAPIFRD